MTEFAAPLPILARYAVMVDVGYIYAAAGELLFGSSSRRDFRVDAVPLIQVVTKHADEIIRGELLRVYWYDAARDRVPTIDQRVIAQMPWVKLRLGNLNARGQQAGGRPPPRAGPARGRVPALQRPGQLPRHQGHRPDAPPRARPGPGRGGRRARGPEVDPDPRPRQHQGPAARPDPAAGHRQGAA